MEHVALYRQFRPENFDEVVEQKAAVTALRQSVKTGRLGHAYLFCGQRGTGKTSIARIFARAINCENPINGNPCNSCPTCRGIFDGNLLDVIEIDAASNRSIDNIKKICDEVNYAPSKAKYKVYIIDEVHMITNEAFNALLKTLEEPPAHAIFLFATTEPHSIPPTILSRCQRFDFRRISTDSIIGRLKYICEKENIKASDDALKLIASLSDGAMRDAISVLDQAASAAGPDGITDESIEEMTGTVNIGFLSEMAEILIDGRFDDLLTKCRELSDSGRDVIQFSLDLSGYFRNLLVVRVMPDPTSVIPASATAMKKMYEIANKTNTNTLVGFVSSLSKMISDLKWSPSVRTSFEINLLRLCGRKIKMDEVPLVVPDFVEKQAAVAKAISEKAKIQEPVAPTPVTESTPVAEPAPIVISTPVAEAEPTIKVAPAPIVESAPVTETVSESTVISEPETPSVPEIKSEPEIETKPEEPIPFFAQPDNSGEAEEEIDPEDIPMENQMDIFSFSSSSETNDADDNVSETKVEEPEISSAPAPVSEKPTGSIFASLSSSFMDDLVIGGTNEPKEKEPEEQAPESNLYEPTGMIGETKQTAVSAAFDISGLIAKQPEPEVKDINTIWEEIKSDLNTMDLTDTSLVVKEDKAYIIFGRDDVMAALKANPDNKRLSRNIREQIEGIAHVYMLRKAQAIKDGLIDPDEPTPSPSDGAISGDAFMQMAQQMGYNTEIHFGD